MMRSIIIKLMVLINLICFLIVYKRVSYLPRFIVDRSLVFIMSLENVRSQAEFVTGIIKIDLEYLTF